MKPGGEMVVAIEGLQIIHQNLPHRRLPEHQHDRIECVIPLRGRFSINLSSSEKYVLARGEMLLIPPGTLHSYETSSSDAEQLLVLLDVDTLPLAGVMRLSKSSLMVEVCLFLLTSVDHSEQLIAIQMLRACLQRAMRARSRGLEIASLLTRANDPRLQKALAFIERNFTDPTVIASLPKASGASSRTLLRLFKQELMLSVSDLILELRMQHARDLLASGQWSVTSVALECGYSSLSQFIQNFKKAFGVLPSQSRNH